MEIQQLLSKYMLEISKVRDEKSLYTAVSEILKKIVSFSVLNVFNQNNLVFSEPEGQHIEKEIFSDYLPWIEQRLYPTFLPLENGYIGLIPVFKANKLLSTIVIETTEEPTAEVVDYIQLLSYLSGITLENLRLIDFVDKAREYFESIINLSNDGIVVLNELKEIEFTNSKAKDNLKDNTELLREIIDRIENNEEFFEVETHKSFFSISVKQVNLLGEKKVLVNIRNITSEKEVQKLKELDKIKTNFIANISHELRTPLAAIKAYVETMLNMPMSQEEIHEFLDVVYSQSIRLEELLSDLLDFSQLESHTMKILKESVNICEIIEHSIETLENMAKEKDVTVEYNCSNLEIKCDRKRIEQVIVNLLSNAIKFSDQAKEKRFVRIDVLDEGEIVKIIVEDNGIGIPESAFDKIFERFYRVDNELTYAVPGTGLGLAIVKEIVELHEGNILVESEVGKYTKFIVTLPKN
ncbi:MULTISPECIES: sensor histidine kinase [Fervidobacterium]|mgnify:FL=1|uniref:histidine kinase n=1 Tax=Fervidobacterium nodosum (strain ATCC 35602 / DSM 5306 / Rt17-B1) TaxID=381764 RepID=A7HK36_FERNB|nr:MULTISPECIES: ATP-binding protein [Fervidobacterium]ABS60269.1 histidine kinase [Fervidobacterium nodosum Rt17-B1]KAF2961451.1 histidine kinase [Fervidobacterium sp. 2310opik-2]PHJ14357.1 histidine kinase [Fervidobacterium sp. SC_NGM5_G05]HOJ93926.1 ATP-binding protein [Fervidobacterium nodosum]